MRPVFNPWPKTLGLQSPKVPGVEAMLGIVGVPLWNTWSRALGCLGAEGPAVRLFFLVSRSFRG